MFRSATFKLTLYYLAIVVIISLLFSTVVYKIGTNDLAFGLHRQTQRLSSDFPVFSNSPYLRPGRDLHAGSQRLLVRLVALNAVVFVGAGFASYGLARRTLRPIEEAHEQQKRFTADVSHELRTPLTALTMESEVALLDTDASKAALRTVLKSNIEEAAKLDLLINNLLRLSRLDAGVMQENFSAISLSEVVAAAINQLDKKAKQRQITIESSLTADSLVAGDRESLEQLIIILLDNAVKYSSNHQTVSVSLKRHDSKLELVIVDKGSGIARDDLEHVFERFYRADAARTNSATTGFGLGLSIAKLIADVHQASIVLTSRPGNGTTATIQFLSASQNKSADK